MEASIGRSGFYLNGTMSTDHKFIRVRLIIGGPQAGAYFALLHQKRGPIEAEVGCQLSWQEQPDTQRSTVAVQRDADPTDRDDWPAQHRWLGDTFEKLDAAFRSRVKDLDANDYVPDEEDEGE